MTPPWAHVQTAHEEEGRHAEGLMRAVTTGRSDDRHEFCIHAFLWSIGDGMPEIADDVLKVTVDHVRHLGEGAQGRTFGPADPGSEMGSRGPFQVVMPASSEVLLQGVSLGRPQVALLEGGNARFMALGQVLTAEEDRLSQTLEIVAPGLVQLTSFLAADLAQGVVAVTDDVESVVNDIRPRAGEGVLDRRLVGLPHVHGNRSNPSDLLGIQALECVDQAGLRTLGSHLQDSPTFQVDEHSDVAMTLADRLFIDTQVGDHLRFTATKATLHRPLHDAPRLVPRDPQQSTGALHGLAGQNRRDATLFKRHRESAVGFCPGKRHPKDTVFRAVGSRHRRMDPRLSLLHVQVTPGTFTSVVLDQAWPPTGRTGQSTVLMGDKYMHLLMGDVHVDPTDVPGGTQLKKGGQGQFVSHGYEDARLASNPLGFRKSHVSVAQRQRSPGRPE